VRVVVCVVCVVVRVYKNLAHTHITTTTTLSHATTHHYLTHIHTTLSLSLSHTHTHTHTPHYQQTAKHIVHYIAYQFQLSCAISRPPRTQTQVCVYVMQ
jgi:hypothetical protein